MKDECKKHGAFSWNELMTTDVESAKKFYTELLGWETEDFPVEGMNYTVVKPNGDPAGGIMSMPPQCEGMPPHWSVYVTVDDVDAASKKTESLGGKVLYPPTNITDVGRFCVIQDLQGAAICLITYIDK